ncbi:MAG TPA: winged helix-turn-helix domain-containing protein [Terriglobales bacterium]|nr:winged helix-turn-helix domain-containing protein [Terriglobales bacterium]
MTKTLLSIILFSFILLTLGSVAAEPQTPSESINSANNIQTSVQVDALGDIHVLWLVPALNRSSSAPGIWYSKYAPNGTKSVPPTHITNSTSITSAAMTSDSGGDAIIVWADTPNSTISTLFMLTYLSTNSTTTQIISSKESSILWPSVAVDRNDTIHLAWTQYSSSINHALVEYGTVVEHELAHTETIASYTGVSAFPPKAQIVIDNSSEHIQIAWGETHSLNQPNSTVEYAKLVTNGTVLTRLQVARFNSTLQDVAITAGPGNDGAFVLWQTDSLDQPIFVSQISAAGKLVFLKQLSGATSQLRYLAVSTDSENNLYVVSYQPSGLIPPATPTPRPITSITYLRINDDGEIVETWNSMLRSPVVSVAISYAGNIYAVSPSGLVHIVQPQSNGTEWTMAIGLVSGVVAAGVLSTEEGKYRLITCFLRHSLTSNPRQTDEVVSVLTKKPGLNLDDLQHHPGVQSAGMRLLVRMERLGAIGSFRDGLSRRFYVTTREGARVTNLATRVLLWIRDHPDIWEAQLSKDLGLSQQIVHYHLKKLREGGLITAAESSNGSRKLYRFVNSRRGNLSSI